jgi:leader peptidase (prepilin peptidase)/N-methyltransferase
VSELSHKPVLQLFVGLCHPVWPGLVHSQRLLALLDLALGLVIGGGFLWLVVEVGKLLFGRRRMRQDEPVAMVLTPAGFTLPDEALVSWDELLVRERDRLVVMGRITALAGPGAADWQPLVDAGGEVTMTVDEAGLHVGDRALPFTGLTTCTMTTREWVEPREVMGMGDVKLLGMLGAALGPGGALFTMAVSSLLGSLGGLALIAVGRGKLQSKIPYGPYIALAALMYILLADEIIRLYVRLVLTLHPG